MLAIIIYFIAAQIIEFEEEVSEVCFDIEDSQDKMEFVILDLIQTGAKLPIGSK